MDPGEHALYAGGGNGCIYEVSLLQGGGGMGAGMPGTSGGTSRHVALEGHSAAVTALALTTDGLQLVSGRLDIVRPIAVSAGCTRLVIHHMPVVAVAMCSKTSRCSVQIVCSGCIQLQQTLHTLPLPRP